MQLTHRLLGFQDARPELTIDWTMAESNNIRFQAHGILSAIQEEVDDLRSFRRAIYGSLTATAMEMARLLFGVHTTDLTGIQDIL